MKKETQLAMMAAVGRYVRKMLDPIQQKMLELETKVAALEQRKTVDSEQVKRIVDDAISAVPKPAPVIERELTIETLAPLLGEVTKRVSEEVVPKIEALPQIGQVEQMVKDAVAALPKPQDGKSVTIDDVKPLVDEAVAALPKPQDGKSVTLDEVTPVLKSMQAEWALDFERRAQALFQKAVDAIPKPADGKDGVGWDDMVVEHDGRRTVTLKFVKGDVTREAVIVIPSVIDAGFWKEGMSVEKGDGVTYGGSYWIAQEDTDSKPEIGNKAWRLAVRKGRDAKTPARVS